MAQLAEEYIRIKDAQFALSFTYPTEEERERLQVIHRDMTAKQVAELGKQRETLQSLLADFESGKLYPQDLDPELRDRLLALLRGTDPE